MSSKAPIFMSLAFFVLSISKRAEASAPTCITIQRDVEGDVADAFISNHLPHRNTNYGDKKRLRVGRADPSRVQALISFDLGVIPAGADIESATVALHQQLGLGEATVVVHRITEPWDEDTVTWNSFDGAYDPAVEASFESGGLPGPLSFDLTALVQAWADGATPNHGVLLDACSISHTVLWSSESSRPERRPELEVCFHECPGAEHLFSKRFGDDREQIGYSVTADSAGNVILAGSAAGTVDFGAGPITLSGSSNAFIAKLDPSGSLLWVRRFDAASSFASAVTVDAADNIVLTGGFRDPIDLGGGPLPNPFAGLQVTFVAKLDPDGNHLWSRAAAGNELHFPRGVAVDAAGNVVVSGSFESFLDFTGGVDPIFSTGGTFDEDVFVSKFDPAGNHLWSKGFGGSDTDRGESVAVDGAGDILLTGFFLDVGLGGPIIDFGGGPLPSAGSSDIFVAKLDPDGGHLWSRSFGDPGSQDASGIAVDAADNVIVAGSFMGTVDFGGGPLTSAGSNDVVVLKLDLDGGHLWSRRFGDADRQDAKTVAVDSHGDVAVSGFFNGSIEIVCAPLTSAGGADIVLARLDAGGNPLSGDSFGDAADQTPTRVAFDPSGDILLTGYFDGVVDFGGGPLVSQGNRDIFLAKFAP